METSAAQIINNQLAAAYDEYCEGLQHQGINPPSPQKWLESLALNGLKTSEQVLGEYQAALAANIMRFFEGRIFAPPTADEDMAEWVINALGHENAAYHQAKVNGEETTELLRIDEKLLDYAVHQIKTVAEMNLTHSERRGALKMIAYDLENRVGARNSSYPPGRSQSIDDIPF